MKNGGRAGARVELRVKKLYEARGWVVTKAGGSLGAADLVALKAGETPLVIQVKGGARNAFNGFGPADRAELLRVARQAGADALLAWWPPRGELSLIAPEGWPQ